ncbi:MAG TPA: DNA methyltransferase [bacterium]|nr:DNA methyltransferase [bacterium]
MRYRHGQHAARATDEYVFHQLLPYLGNKRHLLDLIAEAIDATGCDPRRSVFVDAFAGSGVVARFAKQRGFAVIANDWEPFARVVNTAALIPGEAPPFARLGGYERAIATLNTLPGTDGWVANTLCPADDDEADPTRERMFYRRANGRRIDAIRERIAEWQQSGACGDIEACCLLAPLLYQACWLANTSGVFKGYHAGWGGRNGTALHRILADLELKPLRFLPSPREHRVLQTDAAALAAALSRPVDIVYFDPPYNQHPYASNYHVLNSLVQWDRPELPPPTTPGHKAGIRPDWRARRSAFNSRRNAATALARLLASFDARHLLLSYSTDGLIPPAELIRIAAEHGSVSVYRRDYKRYRTSPTRPSPRPRNVEFVLHVARGKRRDPVAEKRVLRAITSAHQRTANRKTPASPVGGQAPREARIPS